jgi:hypothetical protein
VQRCRVPRVRDTKNKADHLAKVKIKSV